MSEPHPPSRRVVVGVDGSASATAALRWAVAEARLRGAPLSVVHVAADIDDGYANACPDDVLDEALSVASVDADVGTPAVAGLRLTGQAVSELVEQSLDADLMVVGRHGNPDRLHRLLGSVTTGVLHHVRCPVAVVHADPTATASSTRALKHPVLVGIDGSRWSDAAAELAFYEAAQRGVDVLALHVCGEPEQSAQSGRRSSFAVEEAQVVLAQALAPLQQRHPEMTVHTLIRSGGPARQLLIQGERAQLIVVGSHGRGAVTRLLLGSVSAAVACQVRNPVIVVGRF